jgi:LIVCS family branched-chain amino acid:cation transporter
MIMKTKWLVLSTGFALFSMFFGSGNLVFPITVGQESGGHYLLSAFGIIFTGVLVPSLGVFGVMLYKGNIDQFFSSFGKKGVFLFSFLALALMGPFGVLARCLTVAHGALLLLVPNVSLELTSALLCLTIFVLTLNRSKIVTILGSILTPFLLISIASISFFGLSQGELSSTSEVTQWSALKNGFFQGYQTMDLLAAFFFSKFVIGHLYSNPKTASDETLLHKVFLKASMIGGGILSIIYYALVLLGWNYSPILLNQPPQEMLGIIAMASLGSYAAPCVCVAVIFACMTTAIILTSLFADFIRTEVSQNKLGNAPALLITLAISFFVSTLDFAGIAKFLGPILEMVYPALIALTLFNIANKYWGVKSTHWPFTVTLVAKLCII